MPTYRVTFEATGKGTVFMQAYRVADGTKAHSHHYTRDGTHPARNGLGASERQQWDAAAKAEWGEAPYFPY